MSGPADRAADQTTDQATSAAPRATTSATRTASANATADETTTAAPAGPGAAAGTGARSGRGLSRRVNAVLVAAVIALAALPIALGLGDHEEEPFAGADAQAENAVTENDPGYEPWFTPWFTPPSGEVESGLFAAQAAAGAGVIGYVAGVLRTRRRLAVPPRTAAPRPPDAGPATAARDAAGDANGRTA